MLIFAKTLFPFVIWYRYFVFFSRHIHPLCLDMTNITENAKVTQGVAEANAENNSVKTNVEANATVPTTSTHINVAEDIINAMFNDYADDFKELASEPSRTAVNWFVPKDADALVKIQYLSYSQINDNKQVEHSLLSIILSS